MQNIGKSSPIYWISSEKFRRCKFICYVRNRRTFVNQMLVIWEVYCHRFNISNYRRLRVEWSHEIAGIMTPDVSTVGPGGQTARRTNSRGPSWRLRAPLAFPDADVERTHGDQRIMVSDSDLGTDILIELKIHLSDENFDRFVQKNSRRFTKPCLIKPMYRLVCLLGCRSTSVRIYSYTIHKPHDGLMIGHNSESRARHGSIL